jgi:hypothetical protein
MAVLRARRSRRKRKGITRRAGAENGRANSETKFKGSNVDKRHRKPDEISAIPPYRTRLAKSDDRYYVMFLLTSLVDAKIVAS